MTLLFNETVPSIKIDLNETQKSCCSLEDINNLLSQNQQLTGLIISVYIVTYIFSWKGDGQSREIDQNDCYY